MILFLVPLNTNVCGGFYNLTDANKVYLGSACMVLKLASYIESEAFCKANGMDLFDVSNTSLKNALLNIAFTYFGYGTFFNNQWYQLHVKGQVSGQCQRITDIAGPFVTGTGDCKDTIGSYCSYNF
jgi:hypothetical protein